MAEEKKGIWKKGVDFEEAILINEIPVNGKFGKNLRVGNKGNLIVTINQTTYNNNKEWIYGLILNNDGVLNDGFLIDPNLVPGDIIAQFEFFGENKNLLMILSEKGTLKVIKVKVETKQFEEITSIDLGLSKYEKASILEISPYDKFYIVHTITTKSPISAFRNILGEILESNELSILKKLRIADKQNKKNVIKPFDALKCDNFYDTTLIMTSFTYLGSSTQMITFSYDFKKKKLEMLDKVKETVGYVHNARKPLRFNGEKGGFISSTGEGKLLRVWYNNEAELILENL